MFKFLKIFIEKLIFLLVDSDEKEHSFLELLVMLDETFRKLEINNFDCQKRAVCEAHLPHAEGTVGPVASSIVRIFRCV